MAFSFGAPAAAPSGQPGASTSGFSFGQPQNKPATTTGGGFSFGQPAASQPQATGSTAAPAATGGLFGASTSQPQQQQQGAAGPSNTGSTFSFGAQPQQQQQQQPQQQPASTGFGGGLFGSSTNTAGGTGGGFSFGKPPQTTQQQQQQPSTSLFGASTSTAPSFGASQNAGTGMGAGFGTSFGAGAAGQQPQQQQQQQQGQMQQQQQPQPDKKLGLSLAPKIEQIRAAWDTRNAAACRFLYYFYNNAGNAQNLKMIQGRRQDAVGSLHDQLWAAAIRENPDPNRLYPVLALGFPDLQKRVQSQTLEASRQRTLLSTISTRLSTLDQKHALTNTVRYAAASSRQTQLHHRLVSLISKCAVLIPALRGKSIGKEEERLMAILEACEREIVGVKGAGGARLRAKVNELWAMLGVVKAKRETMAREGRRDGTEWAVVDEQGLDRVAKILSSQQQGLSHLSTTLVQDTKTMETIMQGLTGVKLVGVTNR
ncbi:uncharacterized protein PFL1_01634 [Pseudozyma flocculosa PF-1]|uniref:Related to NUP57 - nuclear pore protein n=1 Tax=Pseudozyma flocculosa TaxID=84751 RepID=A0A5C3F0F3_9BASI|nr:uncharacterized protein PFL1_01634 [Pseudozyma flocculosa PF-1]EPQ30733.1 hypothetical protein PFL1_01634 [Pseudozyma flocculosa PF-1]SPO36919.1 related to NUP57 - nuclear pore protein [Pseudozyma flocculosa]